MKKKRILLVSCSIILLCMMIITGMTYSLFTDTFRVTNHLEAGYLNISLQRVFLEYSVLNERGVLDVIVDDTVCDFTEVNAKNMFGIDAKDVKIVPGSYFDAKLRIINDNSDPTSKDYSNVAFDYSVEIVLADGYNNNLARQMQVVITNNEGVTITKKLSELSGGNTFMVGTLLAGERSQDFNIRVEFLDVVDNNSAQGQTAVFDLVVRAVQATTPDVDPNN